MSPLFGFRGRKPTARTAELLVEEFDDELLVYDQRTDRVHCLSPPAWKVWRACDGRTAVEQLGPALGLDAEIVAHALEELEACGLIEGGVTRREATARFARIGAAASAPLVYSIVAPTPALAASAAFCLSQGCGSATGATQLVCSGGCLRCAGSGCNSCPSPVNGDGAYCVAACSVATCSAALFNGTTTPCTGCMCSGLRGCPG
jgi:hypothetical protein